ncbi:hypothetical protein UFOVP228_72 [uncultured Caudovirales phage]|uniref:Uncharacterized protein n=1 Tax=uncultured Caudovirales phage TaxID=2100421 RepID=A0A6J5TBM2_9CAUD|nr:hypothetical protein UFOVP47_30 [uncultured Caudovirales phage]CAB5219441.1 hypothetical protein UFOVP228_72 [uncultured Caudovirales phage]
MAITTAICNTYKQEVLQGLHLAASTYKIALIKVAAAGTYGAGVTNAGTPGTGAPTTANLGTDEAAGTGYTSGGATLAGFSATLQTSTGCLDFTTPTWTTSTISATGAMIYNSTVTNRSVACFDFGGTITSTAGTFTATMPAVGAATSLIRIA